MKIFVAGTRGIPNIPGGVETHCQQLYPLIVKLGHEVLLCRRAPYINDEYKAWEGVGLIDVFCPRKKSMEAIVHTFMAVIEAKRWKADVLHIHAIGPGLIVPFARLLGLKVVMTNHGPDYDRDKWGGVARLVLRLGEKLGGIFSNEVIVISKVIEAIVEKNCRRKCRLIYNGVNVPLRTEKTSYISSLNLDPQGYILAVARFVPEKGLMDLLEAYEQSGLTCKLVIAGDSDHDDEYSRSLKKRASMNPNVILTGYITGGSLHEIYSHARLFVLPSYHEGLPIALLEALSYRIRPLVSDIPANLEVALDPACYFECKNINNLSEKIQLSWGVKVDDSWGDAAINLVKEKYDWDNISQQTVDVYEMALADK